MIKVKNTLLFVVLISGIVFVLSIIRQKPTDENYITTTGLNVRNGAGKNFRISFSLDSGEKVTLLSKKSGWYNVSYLNKTGYVDPKYLSKYDTEIENVNFLSHNKELFLYLLFGIITIILIPIIVKYFRKIQDRKLIMKVTDPKRGTSSERDLILRLLKSRISPDHIFHDLYIQKSNGSYSQIDLAVLTDVGIIVFEVKDYAGWIYGNGNQSQWTQVLAYGKQKYIFQNPIIQNSNHILNLKTQLAQYGNIPCYSVIVFYGDCVLKNLNFIPQQTLIVKYARIFDAIKTILENNELVEYSDKEELIKDLKNVSNSGDTKNIQDQHIENVRDLLGKSRILD